MRVLHLPAAGLTFLLAVVAAGCGGDEPRPDRATELGRLRTEIAVDARERGGRPVLRVRCQDTTRTGAPEGTLDCLAVTDESPDSETIPVPIVLGQPYSARIDPDTGVAAWCRMEKIAGEGATQHPDDIEALPARCGGSGG